MLLTSWSLLHILGSESYIVFCSVVLVFCWHGKTEFLWVVEGHADSFVHGCRLREPSHVVECTVGLPLRVPTLKFFWGEPLWWNTSHNRRMFSVEPGRPLDLSSGMIGSDRTFSCPRPPHTVWQRSVVLAELPYNVSRLIHKGIEIKQLKKLQQRSPA